MKIAFRNINKSKGYSLINITGLAIGIAICMIISFWVQRELSFDKFHENADRIYRVERELFRDNYYSRWPIIHTQQLFAVDNSIFDFELQQGNPKTALTKPRSVVLTVEQALKYFGTANVLGKSLTFELNNEMVDFSITGLLNEVPKNSHIQFDMLMVYKQMKYIQNRSLGVVKDYNFKSVREEIEPLAMLLYPTNISDISIRIMPGNVSLAIDFIKHTWEKVFPDEQFEFSFLDNRLNQLYENERKMQHIFIIFSFLSIFVACLGLFGLASFITQRKTKEIGIRKALGASEGKLFIFISREFVKWVIIANIIAWPIAY